MTTLLLYPGAGSDSSHPSLLAIERAVAPARCVRADFPYRRAGRKAPDKAPVLMASIREVLAELPADEPLVMGGRSMGGRMCSMIAAGADGLAPPPNLRGLVLISYPLHPPGRPDQLRVEHLPKIAVPTLFISGSNDTFGTPGEIITWTATMSPKAKVTHLWLEGKGHDLKGCDHTVAGAVTDFLARVAPAHIPLTSNTSSYPISDIARGLRRSACSGCISTCRPIWCRWSRSCGAAPAIPRSRRRGSGARSPSTRASRTR